MKIIAASDGRAGNQNQALGLAEALARRRAGGVADAVTLRLAPWAAAAPPAVLDALLRAGGARVEAAAYGEPAAQLFAGAAMVIGAGRRSAPAVAAARRAGFPAVQLLNPQMSLAAFDLVIAPAHDGLVGAGVHASLGSMHRMTAARIAGAEDARLAVAPRPAVAALVGGPSKSVGFGLGAESALLDGLRRLRAGGVGVMITASRRTPKRLAAALATLGPDVFCWDGAGENPLFAMLGRADAIIATADSVNMCSEAAALGKPLYVAGAGALAPKLERFHEALAAAGAARPFSVEAAEDPAAFFAWAPTPLDDVGAAADRAARLLPSG